MVEILIVVVILGILAAIVIPQFTSASETAKASSLHSQLQTIRSQLELYQVQHNGNYPPLVTDGDWDKMTLLTDVDQNEYADAAAAQAAGATTTYGPYLQKPPANPFVTATGGANVAIADISGGDAFDPAAGWGYNENTGVLKAMVPNTVDAEALGIDDTADFIVQ